MVDGRLLRGSTGFAGEVGHMHVMEGGPQCGCGRFGCWEALVGLRPLLRDAVPDVLAMVDTDHPLVGPEEKVAHVVQRATAGDKRVLAPSTATATGSASGSARSSTSSTSKW